MSHDAFWALVNAGTCVVGVFAMVGAVIYNGRQNEKQLERLRKEWKS